MSPGHLRGTWSLKTLMVKRGAESEKGKEGGALERGKMGDHLHDYKVHDLHYMGCCQKGSADKKKNSRVKYEPLNDTYTTEDTV